MYKRQEEETTKERMEKGIPLHPEVINWFEDICSELSIDFDIPEDGVKNA